MNIHELIGFIVELAISLYDSILCVHFILRFHGLTWRSSKWSIPTVLAHYGIVLAGDFLIPGSYTVISVIVLLLSMVFSLWVSGAFKSRKKIFPALVAPCVYEIVFILLSSLIYMILSLFVADLDSLMQGSVGISRYIYILLHKTSLFAILMLILHVFRAEEGMDIRNGILTFALSLTNPQATRYCMAISCSFIFAYNIFVFSIACLTFNSLYVVVKLISSATTFSNHFE